MQLSDTWISLVWHKLILTINSLFLFFKECTRIISFPLCYVLDPWTTSELKVPWKVPGIFKVHFMNFPNSFLFFLCLCIYAFSRSRLNLTLRLQTLHMLLPSNPWYHVVTMELYIIGNYWQTSHKTKKSQGENKK